MEPNNNDKVWEGLTYLLDDFNSDSTPTKAIKVLGTLTAVLPMLRLDGSTTRRIQVLLTELRRSVQRAQQESEQAERILGEAASSLSKAVSQIAAENLKQREAERATLHQEFQAQTSQLEQTLQTRLNVLREELKEKFDTELSARATRLEFLLKNVGGLSPRPALAWDIAGESSSASDSLFANAAVATNDPILRQFPALVQRVASEIKSEVLDMVRPLGKLISEQAANLAGVSSSGLGSLSSRRSDPTSLSTLTEGADSMSAADIETHRLLNGTNNRGDYEDDRKRSLQGQFMRMFGRQVEALEDISRKDFGDDRGGGFLSTLAGLLGATGLAGILRGGSRAVLGALGTAAVAATRGMGAALGALFLRGGGVLGRSLTTGLRAALGWIGRRATFAIPWVGPIIGTLLLANDFGLLEGIKEMLTPYVDSVIEAGANGVKLATEWIHEKILTAVEFFTSVKDNLISLVDNGLETAMGFMNSAAEWLGIDLQERLNDVREIANNGALIVSAGLTNISNMVQMGRDKVHELIDTYLTGLPDSIRESLHKAFELITHPIRTLRAAALAVIEPAVNTAIGLYEHVLEAIADPIGKLQSTFKSFAERFKDIPIVGRLFNDLHSLVTDPSNAIERFQQENADFMGSLVTNLRNLSWGDVTEGAANVASAVGGGIRQFAESAVERARNLWTVQPGVNMEGVHPLLQRRFSNAVSEYQSKGGKHDVVITSGFRDWAEQQRLHAADPTRAAAPGKSLHNYGFAIDADRKALNEMDSMGILGKHGLERPVPGEPWHVQPSDVGSAAAAQGIFSADQPKHQESGGFMELDVNGVADSPSTSSPSSKAPPVTVYGDRSEAPPMESVRRAKPETNTIEPGQTAPWDRPLSSSGVSQSLHVRDIPTFSASDSGLVAVNLGVLSGN